MSLILSAPSQPPSPASSLRFLTDTQILQYNITPDILGIFWITCEKFSENSRFFYPLNYFLDGLLTNYTQRTRLNKTNAKSQINNAKKIFVSSNFGSSFFLGHLTITENLEELEPELDELVNLTQAFKTTPEKAILIIDFSLNGYYYSYLQKKYPSSYFKELKLF